MIIMKKGGKEFVGPPTWTAIHTFAALCRYEPILVEYFNTFMMLLTVLFICQLCRDHLKQNLIDFPIDRKDPLQWSYNLHDMVNHQINKITPDQPPKVSPPFSTIEKYYIDSLKTEKCYAPIWTIIHSFAAAYKSNQAEAFQRFIDIVTELLPSPQYRQNFKKLCTQIPIQPYLGNNHDLFFWTYCIHDYCNRNWNESNSNSTPKKSPPYEQVKAYYFSVLGDECKVCQL